MQRLRSVRVFVPAALVLIAAAAAVVRAQDPDLPRGRTSRAEFMRMKLEFSKGVLDGVVNEKYDEIIKGAKALRRLSEAAEWEVVGIPNVQSYLPFTREFQRLTEELEDKARAKNLDGASLAYMQLTMNCVNCHKFVRNKK